MNHYLYAIVDRLPQGWRAPTAGLGGASVVPRRMLDVVVLGSLLEAVPAANPRTQAVHHDVVASMAEAPAILPFRYGTSVPSASLHDWLAARHAQITAGLAAVRGCVEMTVKILCLEAIDRQRAQQRRGPDPGLGARMGERELRALAAALAERAGLPRWQYQPSGSAGNVAAAIAFLVPRAEVAAFLARIAPVASHASGVAVVPTGPWPPYSFAPDLGHPTALTPPVEPAARRAG